VVYRENDLNYISTIRGSKQCLKNDYFKCKSSVFLSSYSCVIVGVTEKKGMLPSGRKTHDATRKAAIYFIQRYSGLSNEAIGKLFGGMHFTAISKASDRLRKEKLLTKNYQNL
jgi:hypothetical protein